MLRSTSFPNLDCLTDLAQRDGVDIRPTLLRVLTDLYVQKPTHPPEEERHYTELALRLIEAVDKGTRAVVASLLARHVDAPLPVLWRLARESADIAEPILRLSSRLSTSDLRQIAAQMGPAHAAIIAKRIGPETLRTRVPERPITTALPDIDPTPAGHADRAFVDRPPSDSATELCELFFTASAPERRLILLNLEYVAPAPPTDATPKPDRKAIHRLEEAALRHDMDALATELERSLRLSAAQSRRIVEDLSGEPMVVAGKALGLPVDTVQRILLFLNPSIGHSVERVYALAQLYEDIKLESALHMLSIWQASAPQPRRRAPHRPLYWDDERAGARPGPADASYRSPSSRDLKPASRTTGK